VDAAACVDRLLAVVRQVVDAAADERVRDEAARRHAAFNQLRDGGRLPEDLAAAAGPFAVDVAVDEELGRHDVQALAHVLADARHRAAAAGLLAVSAVGLVAVLDAAQVLGQCLSAGVTRGGLRLGLAIVVGRGLQTHLLQLRAQARLVLGDRLGEEASLVGVHGLGLGAELPALEASEFEGDLLDLGVAPGDVAVLALQQVAHLDQFAITIDEGLVAQCELPFGMLPAGDPGRRLRR
jgi:hypothetical protein